MPSDLGAAVNPIALGDLDGDGIDELVVGRWVIIGSVPSTELSVRMLVGDAFVQVAQTTVPWRVREITPADLDADGKMDLALAPDGSSWIGLLPGRGDFTFGPLEQLPTPDRVGALVAVDLDGNGLQDVVVSNGGTQNLAVLAGRTGALLGKPRFFASPPFLVASLVTFRPALGEPPDIILTTAGSPMTANYEAFYSFGNLAP